MPESHIINKGSFYKEKQDDFTNGKKSKRKVLAVFSGENSTTIKNINIPNGNYYITCTYKGDSYFSNVI